MVGSWWLVTVVLAAAYSGSLVAHLSLTPPYLPFRSLEDVVKQSEYKWGTLANASLHNLVKIGRLVWNEENGLSLKQTVGTFWKNGWEIWEQLHDNRRIMVVNLGNGGRERLFAMMLSAFHMNLSKLRIYRS